MYVTPKYSNLKEVGNKNKIRSQHFLREYIESNQNTFDTTKIR